MRLLTLYIFLFCVPLPGYSGVEPSGKSVGGKLKENQYRSRVLATKLQLIEEQRKALVEAGVTHRGEVSRYVASLYVTRLELLNLHDPLARQEVARRVSLLEIAARKTQESGRLAQLADMRLAEESVALRSGRSGDVKTRKSLSDPYLAGARRGNLAVHAARASADAGVTFSQDTAGLRPFLARFVPLSVLVENAGEKLPRDSSGSPRNLTGVQLDTHGSSTLIAPASGHVIHAKDFSGFRNLLVIEHSDDLVSVFGNLDELLVTQGESVAAGQPVARFFPPKNGETKKFYYEVRDGGQALPLARFVEQPSRLAAALLSSEGADANMSR
ncbi:MAG: M23 family metallopeptidase [bacterium]